MAAGIAVLAALVLFGAVLAPVYLHNLELERFVRVQPSASDEVLRKAIIDKGSSLGLDIVPDHLQIRDLPGGGREVRYVVRVDFRLYTVDLHFSSDVSGGSAPARE